MEIINQFFQSDGGKLALAVLGVGALDFVLGVAAAFRDSTFALDSIAAWLRSNLVGKIFGIWVLLLFGYATQDLQIGGLPLLGAAGAAAAATYVAATVGSILRSWGPTDRRVLGVIRSEPQKVPTD